jgi:hypothetical protein
MEIIHVVDDNKYIISNTMSVAGAQKYGKARNLNQTHHRGSHHPEAGDNQIIKDKNKQRSK